MARGAEAFIADLGDVAALTKAFTGAEAVYVMIPPDMSSPDPRGYRKRSAVPLPGHCSRRALRTRSH